MHIEKKTIRKLFFITVGAIFFYWLLHETDRFRTLWNAISGLVAPFALGATLAFIINVLRFLSAFLPNENNRIFGWHLPFEYL